MSTHSTIRVSLPDTIIEALETLASITSLDRSLLIEQLLPENILETPVDKIQAIANIQAMKSLEAFKAQLAESAKAKEPVKPVTPTLPAKTNEVKPDGK